MPYLPRAARRESIVEAAAALIGRDGLGAVTARNVAAELGGSPGQVHHHFASTDALVAEGWLRYTARQVASYRDAVRDLDRRGAVELFFEDLVRDGTSGVALDRWAEAGAHAQLRPVVAEAYLGTLAQLTDVLADVLADGPEPGTRKTAGRLLMIAVGLAGLTRLGAHQRQWSQDVMRSALRAELG